MKYSWTLADFDTKLFGFKTVKINHVEPGSVDKLIADIKKSNIIYTTYRLPANNFTIIHELEKAGFILVDGLISLETKVSEVQARESDKNIREATKDDIVHLRRLSGNIFYFSRFYNDPFIPKRKADELFVSWVENSIKGRIADLVLVWEEKGKILGYITLQKKGQIPLVGVSSESRGKGIGKKLIFAAIAQFKKWGVDTVEIETQMQNIQALRAYQACGFKVVNSYLTFSWHNNG